MSPSSRGSSAGPPAPSRDAVPDLLPLCLSSGLGWRVPQPPLAVLAFMGFEWKFHLPLRVGDTIRSRSRSAAKRSHEGGRGGLRGAGHPQPARRGGPVGPAHAARGEAEHGREREGRGASSSSPPPTARATTAWPRRSPPSSSRRARPPRVVDHFRELVHPVFDDASRSLYYGMLRRTPLLWGAAYWLGDQLSVSSPLLMRLNRLGMRKLRRLLLAEQPDHVVSVHPTPVAALSELRARGVRDPAPHHRLHRLRGAHAVDLSRRGPLLRARRGDRARPDRARGAPRARGRSPASRWRRSSPSPPTAPPRAWPSGCRRGCPCCSSWTGPAGGFGRLEDATRKILEMEEPLQAARGDGARGARSRRGSASSRRATSPA